MASQNSNPSYEAKLSYSGFDMSHKLKFSSTVGELLPVYYDILQPGDKVSLQSVLRSRTMPLQTAAMCDLTEHLEWFFVPITQIYQFFDAFYYGIQDVRTSMVTGGGYVDKMFPYIPYDIFSEYLRQSQHFSDSYFPLPDRIKGGIHRVLETLGVPIPNFDLSTSSEEFGMGFCPILLCAYQKIFMDYYRDSERDRNNPSAYNLDKYYLTGTMESLGSDWTSMFTLRYRRWRPDFFVHGYVSPLFGSRSVGAAGEAGGNGPDLTKAFQQWLVPTNFDTRGVGEWTNISTAGANPEGRGEYVTNSLNPTALSPFGIAYQQGSSVYLQQGNLQSALSPTSIRTSFAVQKLLEITRRSGKHFDAQQLAHFGVDVPMGINGECVKIGETAAKLTIGDVIATSAGSAGDATSVLGQIGGKGYNYDSSKPIKFMAPTHGVLMCIYSAEPVADYANNGYDYLNCLMDRSDWPSPVFDNLGMQPMFRYQTYFEYGPNDLNNRVLRWKFRYFPFKQKYNKVCGALSRSLSSWTPQRDAVLDSLSDYYISPYYLDSIMVKNYEFTAGTDNSFDSDPLIHELYFNVQKSSKMSAYGLEQL